MNDELVKQVRYGAWISILIGFPIYFFFLFIFLVCVSFILCNDISFLLCEEAYIYIWSGLYGIIALLISLLITLWISGKNIVRNLSKGDPLLLVALKHSYCINFSVWLVYGIVNSILIPGLALYTIGFSIISFFIFAISSTFTISILICYLIKKNQPKSWFSLFKNPIVIYKFHLLTNFIVSI